MGDQSKVNYRKTWTRLFLGILGAQAILELIVGGAILFDFPTAVETGFGITYNSELAVLGIVLGLYLLLLTALLIASIIWTSRNNIAGVTLGIILGSFLLILGMALSLRFANWQGLQVDGIRGGLTTVFGFMSGKEIMKSNKL